MAWIESHQTVGHHPKTIRFAELLHVSLPTAVGHLHYFWWWALDFASTGEIRTTPSVLARACEWKGKPDLFRDALVSSGFIEVRDGQLLIHDWMDYAGRLVEKRAANRERQRKHRHAENGVTSRVTNALVTGLPYPTVPNPTVPDLTVPHPQTPSATAAEGAEPSTDRTAELSTNGSTSDACCVLCGISGGLQHADSCSAKTTA